MSMDPSEGAVQLLQTASEGRCLYRDVRGRTGYIQILPAADAASGRLRHQPHHPRQRRR